MRVARKPIHAREDCFAATEGGSLVRIATLRNMVLVDAQTPNGGFVSTELSLPAFAKVIVTAINAQEGK